MGADVSRSRLRVEKVVGEKSFGFDPMEHNPAE